MKKQKRIYGLDILRALAILFVVYQHAYFKVASVVNEHIYRSLVPDGVSVFFVLSGFLIGGILLKTIHATEFKPADLLNFWQRRWLRTLPAYFVTLGLLYLIGKILHNGPYLKTLIPYAFFVQPFLNPLAPEYTESWSLAIEEWFYLSIPFVLFVTINFTRSEKRKIILSWVVFTLLAVTLARTNVAYYYHPDHADQWDARIRRPVFLRLDSIMFGFLGACMKYYRFKLWGCRNLLFAAGLGLFALTITRNLAGGFGNYYNYVSLSLEGIATLCLIPKLDGITTGRGTLYRFLTFTSLISYSMYLLNGTPYNNWIAPQVERLLNNNHTLHFEFVRLTIFIAWAYLSAYILYSTVEKWGLYLRERRRPKEAASLAIKATA